MHATLLLHVIVLLVGSVLLSVMYESIVARGADTSFSLPFLNILVVTVVGAGLSIWWGWKASLGTLAVYGLFCLVGGLLDRD